MIDEGYLTSNSNSPWPFDEDDPSFSSRVAKLFADASITVYPWESDDVFVKNVVISGSGTFRFTVSKTSYSGQVTEAVHYGTVDREKPYFVTSSGNGFTVWSSFVLDSFQVLQGGPSIFGSFKLSKSCIYARAPRVRSFTLINGDVASDKISGDVKFIAGNNMYVGNDLSQAMSMYPSLLGADKGGIVLSAIPGAGAGRVPCAFDVDCGEDEGKDNLDSNDMDGTLVPDAQGDVVIEGDGCYQISPDPFLNRISITGRCTACCQCDDYVDIGNRLGKESRTLSSVYGRLMGAASTYNSAAQKFNESLDIVSMDELLVKCVSVAQRTDIGDASSVHMDRSTADDHKIQGSIDRGQAVISIKNTSIMDMVCDVTAVMDPQKLILATVVTPKDATEDCTSVETETVDCSEEGSFSKEDLELPSGSGITIQLYGAVKDSQTPSGECNVTGEVTFKWDDNEVTKKFEAIQAMP